MRAIPQIKLSLDARERLRRRYRPRQVRILFVGESPPASGRFFYSSNSGLYRALRDTFLKVFPEIKQEQFLHSFSESGCYLVDLCGKPVDKLDAISRRQACKAGEPRLAAIVRQLRPQAIVTLTRSIAQNVERVKERAAWQGVSLQVPYPGRWKKHRLRFEEELIPLLRQQLSSR